MLRTEHYLTDTRSDYRLGPIMFHNGLLLRNLAWDAIRMTAAGVLSPKADSRVYSTWGTGEVAAEVPDIC